MYACSYKDIYANKQKVNNQCLKVPFVPIHIISVTKIHTYVILIIHVLIYK